ncbi:NAD(P)/FAD-dependent oxidoreductase [Bacillus toyonensis]|uniref:phytoene desaturase family protein n=1 Tax=Bacillus toyonensis TaxID=155322 RepID=UPI002E21A1D5|nr:NAD(P)/FAD-dependent oxidoreductase [Bacillus toyonensis]
MVKFYDIAVIGGGLSGLSVAALLSEKNKKVCVIEKSVLGGRALAVEKKGFIFNYGAHAVYGLDRSLWTKLQEDLQLNIEWKHYDPTRTFYYKDGNLLLMPSNIESFLNTELLSFTEKIQFLKLLSKIMFMQDVKDERLFEWVDKQSASKVVIESFLQLVSSNFFIKNPGDIPMKTIVPFYKRIFTSTKGVSYIQGGWNKLIDELRNTIIKNNGDIITKDSVKSAYTELDKVTSVSTKKDQQIRAKQFIFAIPPAELKRVLGDKLTLSKDITNIKSNNVLFYDIGLSEKIETNYSYIKDWDSKVFITDTSHYDPSVAPDNGQLISAVAYLSENSTIDEKKDLEEEICGLFDKFYPGWRDKFITERISKSAVIQEISPISGKSMEIRSSSFSNVFFVGEWTKTEGCLSEKSVQSAYACLDKIISEN